MKKTVFLLFLSIAGFSAFAQRINEVTTEWLPYDEGVEFRVKGFTNTVTVGTSNFAEKAKYKANDGEKFKTGIIEFRNTSAKDKIVNFSDFYLTDDKGNKYEAKFVEELRRGMKGVMQDASATVQALDFKKFTFGFTPSFPVSQLPKLVVKGKVIALPWPNKS